MVLPLISPFQKQEQKDQDKKLIHYQQAPLDYGHFIVCRLNADGSKEIIGHIYTEIDGDETRYISTNPQGREIFSPSNDFNSVDLKFERYARLIELPKNEIENSRQSNLTNYQSLKNQTTMQTKTKSTEKQKFNQLVFVEYEKPTKEGHFITIVDSYRNNIGKIHKNYNEELKKFEYTAYDHAGNPIGQSEQVWQLKNDFIKNREELLELAHQRRIETNENKVQETEKDIKTKKQDERKVEPKSIQANKNVEKFQMTKDDKSLTKQSENKVLNEEVQDSREQELEDLRSEREDERGEHDLER